MKKHADLFGVLKKTLYLCTAFQEQGSKCKNAPVAQLVEHLTLNQGVQGSNPCGCTEERLERVALIVCYKIVV